MIRRKPLALVIYTDKVIPARFAGVTVGPMVFIRPSYRDDAGLHAHELTHARQFWRSAGILGLLWMISKSWRLRLEVEAYRAQLDADDQRASREIIFSGYLATRYGLGISQDQALELITKRNKNNESR